MQKHKQLELPLVIDSSRPGSTWSADTWHDAQKKPKKFNHYGPLNERQFSGVRR